MKYLTSHHLSGTIEDMSNPFRRKVTVPTRTAEQDARIKAARKAAHSMDRWNHHPVSHNA